MLFLFPIKPLVVSNSTEKNIISVCILFVFAFILYFPFICLLSISDSLVLLLYAMLRDRCEGFLRRINSLVIRTRTKHKVWINWSTDLFRTSSLVIRLRTKYKVWINWSTLLFRTNSLVIRLRTKYMVWINSKHPTHSTYIDVGTGPWNYLTPPFVNEVSMSRKQNVCHLYVC